MILRSLGVQEAEICRQLFVSLLELSDEALILCAFSKDIKMDSHSGHLCPPPPPIKCQKVPQKLPKTP